jgi:hypothetical protein
MRCSVTDPDSCRRCAELEDLVAELESRLQFRQCGHNGPGVSLCTVAMPDGREQAGWLCRPHIVLLSGTPFNPRLVAGIGYGRMEPCQWRVPAEEAMEGNGGAGRDDAALLEEVPP